MKLVCSLACLLLALPASAMKPTTLQCEYLTDPLGIDSPRPRLFWKVESSRRADRQTAYQILVARDEAILRANRGDLWDSGRVESDQTTQVVYAGKPLASGQRCVWKVRVWDKDGKPSGYSPVASWEMGLLEKADWHGKWIGRTTDAEERPAPMLRRAFELTGKVKRARIYICGLGYYDLHLNGKLVNADRTLDPGYTRFDRRDLYATYDVTPLLKEGRNAVGAVLGNGWYNVQTRAVWYFDKAPWRAAPKLLMEMRVEYADGRSEVIASDERWKVSTGPIVFNSIYGGETYDARLEKPGWDTAAYDDSAWEPAKVVDAPGGVLSAQAMPPIRVTETIKPVSVTEPRPGVFLIDMGQNFAGHAELTVSGPAGTAVQMRYAEKLHPDGTLDASNIEVFVKQADKSQQFQTDTYILKGGGTETWEARFVYHGFQYVEVTGFPGRPTLDSLRGKFHHSDIASGGEFECSNPLLNRIQRATRWAYLSNLQSIPTDCPTREKNGWTGDAHLAAEQGMLNFYPPAVYRKWINDLGDEQRPSGELPGIVPSSGWGYEWGNGPAWDSAFLLIPWYLHEYYGDTRILESHYEGMRRYVDYLTSKADRGIVSIGLGDWVPYKTETPVEVTSTAYYFRDARIVSEAARLLGRTEDARNYAELAQSIRAAFVARFVDVKSGTVANGSQTALSCALYQGLAPADAHDDILRNLIANIEQRDGHIDTGILGAKYLLNCLMENGRDDEAYRIVAQMTQPGWGWWMEQGATTLWESWGGTDSRNHIMFGDVSAWFYKALAGIRPDPDAPGFKHFVIKPGVVGDLTYARASYDSIRGRIVSDWKLDGARLNLRIQVPANTSATVYVPITKDGAVMEGALPAERAEGVKLVRREEGFAVYEVGSGQYRFTSSPFEKRD